ncbi:stage III sporulation protein AB [Faecalimonas sp.]
MQKLFGCILIVFASSAMGWSKGIELKKHLVEVENMRKMFLMLRSEIAYIKSPLPEAFRHIGKRMGGIFRDWLLNLSEQMIKKKGVNFLELWSESIEQYWRRSYLTNEDIEKLKSVGENMGYLDEKMQIGTIDLYVKQLELEIQCLQKEFVVEKRLYHCLGIMGGIFLAVILI